MSTDEFVFRKKGDGSLEFVGDFEGLYRKVQDPWEQSGHSGDAMAQYYKHSRHRLATVLKRVMSIHSGPVLEVGCGHGHVVDYLSREMPYATIEGIDVSDTAIAQAKRKYPNRRLRVGDARLYIGEGEYRVVILNQILWYVMHDLLAVVQNCHRCLEAGGILIFSQAFLREQKYGRDVIDGFSGLISAMLKHDVYFQLVGAEYEASGQYKHQDGILVFMGK